MEKFSLLKNMRSGEEIPGFVWKEVVCAAYFLDSSSGFELLQ